MATIGRWLPIQVATSTAGSTISIILCILCSCNAICTSCIQWLLNMKFGYKIVDLIANLVIRFS